MWRCRSRERIRWTEAFNYHDVGYLSSQNTMSEAFAMISDGFHFIFDDSKSDIHLHVYHIIKHIYKEVDYYKKIMVNHPNDHIPIVHIIRFI